MTNKMLKLTPVALSIFAAFQVNAALYNVVPIRTDGTTNSSLSYSYPVGTPDWIAYTANATIGSAIQDSDFDAVTDTDADPLSDSCFNSSPDVYADGYSTTCDTFLLGGETRLAGTDETIGTVAGAPIDGVSFREEAPFGIDNAFSYVQTQADFEDYCSSYLGYTDSICSSWAAKQWPMWYRELNGSDVPNAIAFLEGDSSSYDNSVNTVINQVTADEQLVGISSLGDSRTIVTALSPTTPSTSNKTRAWKTDGTYTVGSVSSSASNDYGTHYSSKAAIWDNTQLVEISWQSSAEVASNEYIAQGSMRDFVVADDATIYGVGFNSWDDRSDNNMNAAVFKASAIGGSWTSTPVSNVRATSSSGYGRSVLTGINKNLVAIGSVKLITAEAGAYANKPFIIDNAGLSTLNASFFAKNMPFSFISAGGEAAAINNYNEIVGQIDTENTREVNGKPRRKRAYIYPYNGTGTLAARRTDIFNNQAWLLDDLTNDGSASSNNNAFRIISANDINDAGVIAATAIYCAGGYDSTAYDAQCGEGTGTETTVAVKLVPIAGASSSDIVQRSYETSTSTRQGASIGSVVVAFLGLVLFGRRRKSLSIS